MANQKSWGDYSSDGGDEIVYLGSNDSAYTSDYILVSQQSSKSSSVVDAQLSDALASLSIAPPKQPPKRNVAASSKSVVISTPTVPSKRVRNKEKKKKQETNSTSNNINSGKGNGNKSAQKKKGPAQPVSSTVYPSPPATPAPPTAPTTLSKKARKRAAAKAAGTTKPPGTGLGERTIVDDVSEIGETTAAFVAAQKYIATFIANPPAVLNNGALLPLLQALIVELGIESANPPNTLTAAKKLLKARAFIGVKEYLTAREVGPSALSAALYPSRQSLIRALRTGKATRVSRGWVKSSGLAVLLVNTYQ